MMTDSSKSIQVSNSANSDIGAAESPPPVLFLEICRGATQFPRRPVTIGRYLIGSGALCDLRLGGDDMPILHSVLHVDGSDALLEAVSEIPALTVNGQPKEQARLQDGDVIAIGTFEFEVQRADSVDADRVDTLKLPTSTISDNDDSAMEENLEDLTATTLVNLIEAEERRVKEFESRRGLGAEALLQAALDRTNVDDEEAETIEAIENRLGELVGDESSDDVHSVPFRVIEPEPEAPAFENADEDLEQIILRLDDFSAHLERRSERLAEREAGYAEASSELIKAQQRLAAHLELLQRQIEMLESNNPSRLRASA